MSPNDKPLAWLHGEIKSPPFSKPARLELGFLLRRLQRGEPLSMPHSRPMPSVGERCHELRVTDADGTWRLIYRIDSDAMSSSKTKTPKEVLGRCQKRLERYDSA